MNLVAVAVLLLGSGALIVMGAPELLAMVGLLKFSNMPIAGMRPSLVTQFFRDPGHNGTDIGVPIGTPCLNVAPGTVVQVTDNPNGKAGRVVIVRGRLPFAPTIAWGYAHLSRIDVKLGQKLEPGDIVGLSGNSGLTRGSDGVGIVNREDGRGAHLHFTVLDVVRGFDGINPEPFLPESIREGQS